MHEYLDSFAEKYELKKFIRTGHQVRKAEWDDGEGSWRVDVEDLAGGGIVHDICDVLISATGVLNQPRWLDVPGIKDFRGPVMHSARWDKEVELADKRVGVIGNG